MKYITFKAYGRSTVINRSNIIGFTSCDPRLMGAYALLDSGAEVFIQGLTVDEAFSLLTKFDEENK